MVARHGRDEVKDQGLCTIQWLTLTNTERFPVISPRLKSARRAPQYGAL